MKKPMSRMLIYLIILSLLVASLVACSPNAPVSQSVAATATVALSPTVERCAPANLPNEVAKITRLMKRFDDISVLAQTTPNQQLAVVVLELYRIQGDAEELEVLDCLAKLHKEQLNFMHVVTAVMGNFIGGVKGEQLQQQIMFSRKTRTDYEVELGKLLGYEYHTPTPWPTPTATQVPPTSTPAPVTVTAGKDVTVYVGPGTQYPKAGTLVTGAQANVIGRSKDFLWVLFEMWNSPDQKAWVPAVDVTLSAALTGVPEATAIPSPQ